ncbi:hypothetical protein BEYONPHE_132 [Bacillus phage Beyonphe]|nr:hypothetical protein BEYONPHE_132 [Bacillus phage Beyonphe]
MYSITCKSESFIVISYTIFIYKEENG